MKVTRFSYPGDRLPRPVRVAGYLSWHFRTALAISRWMPDAVIMIEPHSALAAWMHYRILDGSAPLFIHHHEYYAPEDFAAPGMRILRSTLRLERDDLFPRAVWVSQTNHQRLALLRSWNPGVHDEAAGVLPNYPPLDWIRRATAGSSSDADRRTKLIYLGSASLEDTFIREICSWAGERTHSVSLHICGNNISPAVWDWIRLHGAENITTDPKGIEYADLPELLPKFDVGLVLYKGNTLNFVHNVPNKAIEYLACGLDVWYPRQMLGMRNFHDHHPELHLHEIDFEQLPKELEIFPRVDRNFPFEFTCETAARPLMARLAGFDRDHAK